MHGEDLVLYHGMDVQAAFLGVPTPELTNIDQLLKEGDTLQWGGFQASVIHTPGHTPGSVCLYLPKTLASRSMAPETVATAHASNDASAAADASALAAPNGTLTTPQLFAGDTLFAGSIGRTDLWGGSMEQIMDSLRAKLLELPDDTKVYPGHGTATTIGQERHTNPFLLEA
jgi:glyoxylase-like metal-dependent hydrolase (beta-lactamase superfamily II)